MYGKRHLHSKCVGTVVIQANVGSLDHKQALQPRKCTFKLVNSQSEIHSAIMKEHQREGCATNSDFQVNDPSRLGFIFYSLGLY